MLVGTAGGTVVVAVGGTLGFADAVDVPATTAADSALGALSAAAAAGSVALGPRSGFVGPPGAAAVLPVPAIGPAVQAAEAATGAAACAGRGALGLGRRPGPASGVLHALPAAGGMVVAAFLDRAALGSGGAAAELTDAAAAATSGASAAVLLPLSSAATVTAGAGAACGTTAHWVNTFSLRPRRRRGVAGGRGVGLSSSSSWAAPSARRSTLKADGRFHRGLPSESRNADPSSQRRRREIATRSAESNKMVYGRDEATAVSSLNCLPATWTTDIRSNAIPAC
mmetsp:Transcript_66554/g.188950  ORF Transcript_66554/g.188950 Transcript_66554/m.188950 type:complete len:283 (-) Transcript_66554:43-891(-)